MAFKACMSLLGHTVYYMVWPNKGTHALKTIVARTAFHKLRWRTGSDQALWPTRPFLPTNQALRSPPQGLWLKWHMALDLKVGVWSGLPVGSPCAAPPAHQSGAIYIYIYSLVGVWQLHPPFGATLFCPPIRLCTPMPSGIACSWPRMMASQVKPQSLNC